jgi:integrase
MKSDPTSETRKKARNGEGNTYKFRNGYRTVIESKGRVITATGRTMTESRNKAKEKLQSLPNIEGTRADAKNLIFGDFMRNWLKFEHKQQIAHSTYIRYGSLLNTHILPALGLRKIQEITKVPISNLFKQMAFKGQSPRSQQQTRALLSVAFNYAVKEELIAFNPVLKTSAIRQIRQEINPLTLSEAKLLVWKHEGSVMEARLRIALFYGLRQGEALGLQWKDIDFETSQIHISKQLQNIDGSKIFVELKSKSSKRTLELDSITLDSLSRHRLVQITSHPNGWNPLDLVFPSEAGEPKDDRVDSRQWKKALAMCKISERRLHDARHTAATILYDQGADIEVIRRFLGNASVELTSKTYVHHSSRALRGAANLIGAINEL